MPRVVQLPPDDESPTETVEKHAVQVKELAGQITDRIIQFENWLAKLPGRVEAQATIPDPDAPEEIDAVLIVRLHRISKQWVLSFGYVIDGNDEDSIKWELLKEASLDTKALAIKVFPKLLDRIITAQADKVAMLEKARDDFDRFADDIGMVRKEGK